LETVLITGGSGLVGTALANNLVSSGYKVIILSRNNRPQNGNISFAKWDVNLKYVDIAALKKADYIVHLAGAGVMDKKWTKEYKEEIVKSRVDTGNLLVETLTSNNLLPKAFISASAIGWYDNLNILHTEDEDANTDFLGNTCKLWEETVQGLKRFGVRLVTIRIGIVLSTKGGALKEFIKPLKFGVAAPLASGNQIISWIHISDLCNIFLAAIKNSNMNGIYNGVAPKPVSNKYLTVALAKLKNKFFITLNVPAFVLKILLGEKSIEVLKSNNVSSKKIESTGFSFEYPEIEGALKNLLATNL
jgi:uncharacterized protein